MTARGAGAVKRAAGTVLMPPRQVARRPRSPNPTHMPEDLNRAPALKPGLPEPAKNWVEIAVSQRSSPNAVSHRNGPEGWGAADRQVGSGHEKLPADGELWQTKLSCCAGAAIIADSQRRPSAANHCNLHRSSDSAS